MCDVKNLCVRVSKCGLFSSKHNRMASVKSVVLVVCFLLTEQPCENFQSALATQNRKETVLKHVSE